MSSIRQVCAYCGHRKSDYNPITQQCESFETEDVKQCPCKRWEPKMVQVRQGNELSLRLPVPRYASCPHCSDYCPLAEDPAFKYYRCRIGCCTSPMVGQSDIDDNYYCNCDYHYVTRLSQEGFAG